MTATSPGLDDAQSALKSAAKAAAAREVEIDFLNPPGEAALTAPDSLQWRVFRNTVALGVGGVAAVLLEFADARIRSGVWDHSVYPVDPIGRSRRTGAAAMVGVYGPASAARRVIAGVNRLHSKVSGVTPGGRAYKALEPELLDWVSATAGFGFMKAYDRFVRPLSAAEQTRFFEEGGEIGKLYGVRRSVRSEADFLDMMNALAPDFEPHPINLEFLNIIASGKAAPTIPKFLHRALARGAVSILPTMVRERLELGREWDLTPLDDAALRLLGRISDRVKDRKSPAWQAAVRLGLPGDFSWRSPEDQARILASRGAAPAATR
jgi:uncharacterized protein (DUF2236 family)